MRNTGQKLMAAEGVSHPRARDVPSGVVSRRVKSSTVAGQVIGEPPRNMHSANRATWRPQGRTGRRGR